MGLLNFLFGSKQQEQQSQPAPTPQPVQEKVLAPEVQAAMERAERGLEAEQALRCRLEQLPGNKAVLTNLNIKKETGGKTQIDAVVIHETGIFVFESKNMKGWIFGDSEGKNWTQKFPKSSYQFYNPIFQNRNHIVHLAKSLNMQPEFFHSIIVFGDEAVLKKVPADTDEFMISMQYDLTAKLSKQLAALPSVFLPQDIESITKRLQR